MSIRTILVVDDSSTERSCLTDILCKHGYEVIDANSGEEGGPRPRATDWSRS